VTQSGQSMRSIMHNCWQWKTAKQAEYTDARL